MSDMRWRTVSDQTIKFKNVLVFLLLFYCTNFQAVLIVVALNVLPPTRVKSVL